MKWFTPRFHRGRFRSLAPTSFVLAAARALANLTVYRYAGCTCCCGKPNRLRSDPPAVVPTNDERIFVFGDRSDHVATGSPQTSRKLLALCDEAFRKATPVQRAPHHAPNRGDQNYCSRNGMQNAGRSKARVTSQALAGRRRPETYRQNYEALFRCRETGRPRPRTGGGIRLVAGHPPRIPRRTRSQC